MKQAIVAKGAWRIPGRRGESRICDALITLRSDTLEITIEPIQLTDHELILPEAIVLELLGSLAVRFTSKVEKE